MMDRTLVKLYILNSKDEEPRCTRMPCEGVATFGEFRALLEKKPDLIPWPFDFYDAEMKCRIATESEQSNLLESYDHKVTVIRSDDKQAMEKKRKRVDEESMALLEPTTVKEVIPPAPTVYIAPVACVPISAAPYEEPNEHEETSCPKLDPKHKVFLSHSGVEKSFVGKLCKLLEEHNHYPFFDQRPDSLPKGKKFAGLIIEAAKTCRVAVVVLSEDYLSSKWPMIELAEFVSASKSSNKDLNLLPLFYKVCPHDLDDPSIKDKWMPKWIELARADGRVDPEKWAEAVRELRRANGIDFYKSDNKNESYRNAIVKEIFERTPPDLLYDTSGIHGGDRICKILADKFQQHRKSSASVLGLYGMGGLGKTTISKCLCNHFTQEFLGRVCYIEMKEGVDALVRQQEVMRKLLRLPEPLVQKMSDASQGWGILKTRMKENRVLLIIDNIQTDVDEEALKYLNVEHNPQSKIMFVSRSLDVVGKLLGDPSYCCEIPRLERKEAIGILLQQGGQSVEDHSLSKEEQEIIEGCVEEACFRVHDVTQTTFLHEVKQYHPLAIKALGAYLEERSETCGVLSWGTYLDEYRELKGSGACYDTVFKILGLRFRTLDKMKQLMYLDIVLYARSEIFDVPLLLDSRLEDIEMWLANIYDVRAVVVKQKIAYFRKSGMLNIEREQIIIHDLYEEYAKWALKHIINSGGLVGVWADRGNDYGVEYLRIPEELQSSPGMPGSCWQELRRICLVQRSFRGFAVTKFQEWQNVVVLQLIACRDVITLNLQGLTCIRHLELRELESLESLILTEDEITSHDTALQASCVEPKLCTPRPWLQYVVLSRLSSLEHLSSFTPFTSLKYLEVVECGSLREPPRVQHCVHLRRMWLEWCPQQKTFPNLNGLTSLRDFTLIGVLDGEGLEDSEDSEEEGLEDSEDSEEEGLEDSEDSEEEGFETLKLEGLGSLISLRSLKLIDLPVRDLNGLERLHNVEVIHVRGPYPLEDLSPLESLASSSLHFLKVNVSDEQKKVLEKLQGLISQKRERLRAQGERVPSTPFY